MTAAIDGAQRGALQRLTLLRRQAGASSLMTFSQTDLPAHFRLTPSSMHQELFVMLESASRRRGIRLAVAAPRGHAKSTIVSLAYILWCICYGKEPFIVLISNTLDQASDALSHIKTELQGNPRLLGDFPDACEPPGSLPPAPRWRRDEIITRNGVKVTALGAETKVRGRRHHEHRPTVIVLDDIENEVEVRSADQRKRKEDWFNKAVLKAGTSHTNVIVVGTILHFDSLLAKLIDPKVSPGWTGHKYQAVCSWSDHPELWSRWESIFCHQEAFDARSGPAAATAYFGVNAESMLEGTKVLWPQLEDYQSLMELRLVEGRLSFDSEKQNEPVNPEDCYFQESDFHYWDDEFGSADQLIEAFKRRSTIVGACDPSMGREGRTGDDSAIVSLLRDGQTGILYVLDADIRRRKPDVIIDDVIAYHRRREYQRFTMETNQFQKFLSDELQRRSREAGVYMPVSGIHNTADKLGRIQRLQPLVSSGTLRFSRRQVTLLDQLRQFPMGAHDDGPDALEMAVSAAGGWYPMTCSRSRIRTPQVSIYDDPRLADGATELYFGRGA